MTKSLPCILLYNPISGHGHLDSWNSLFASILLARGYQVLCLTPDPAFLEKVFTSRDKSEGNLLHLLPWNVEAPKSRLHLRWYYLQDRYLNDRPDSRITQGMPLHKKVKKLLLKVIIKSHYSAHSLRIKWQSHILRFLRRDAADESGYLCPGDMARRIAAALPIAKVRPDFLFVMYMDMFKTREKAWRSFAKQVRLPWGGIRFAPLALDDRHKSFEQYYHLAGLRGMCLLDESACRKYASVLPKKFFKLLPDITNAAVPSEMPSLATELRARAGERTVVFLGGSLDVRKNLGFFSRLARMADPNRWFFALVGRVYRDTLTSGDKQDLEDLASHEAGNTLLHLDFIEDERDFNAMIQASDIIFAVYKGFPHSSNMLSKAAHLRRPILVSDRHLMGERVRRYGIGLAVPEDDPAAALSALEDLRTNPVSEEAFASYRNDFCEQAMGDALDNFLRHCLEAGR